MIDAVARLVGSSPEKVEYFQRGDLEIYRVDPPLCGYRIIAAAMTPYAMGAGTTPCRRRCTAWPHRYQTASSRETRPFR